MDLTKECYHYYCRQVPPTDFNKEMKGIEDKLRIYPQNKFDYIRDYLKRKKWIRFYLYCDKKADHEIYQIQQEINQSATPSVRYVNGKIDRHYHYLDEIDRLIRQRIFDRIDHEIEQQGGIINYLAMRHEFHKTDYYKNRCSPPDFGYDESEESRILNFLNNLIQLIEEIARIERETNVKKYREISGNEKLFKLFRSKSGFHQKIFNCLVDMAEDGDIIIKKNNWDCIINGKQKIVSNLTDKKLLAFMQALQNNGFIVDYEKDATKHCERIDSIFQPKKKKEGYDGFNTDAMMVRYTKKQNIKKGRYYHYSIETFEKKLKIPN